MSPLSKVLYSSLILLLAWLAVAPHWPAIREEAENFYAAWQQIRSAGRVESPAAPQEVSTEQVSRRERAIVPPKPITELPGTTENKALAQALDPFIREARERAQEDPKAAMQWLQEQSTGAERLRGMLEVVALWAAKDSETALLWLESNAQGIARLETLNSGVELWAERDPAAAAGWIEGMANDRSKVSAAKSLAATWGKRDPRAAAVWLDGLPGGPVRQEAAGALALAWMETDPPSAAAWAEQEAQGSGDNQLLLQTINQYAQLAPDEAEAFVRSIPVEDPFEQLIYAEHFVQARTENDPVATAAWLQSLPQNDPLNQPESTAALMQVWAKTDSIAASAWLNEQAPGPRRDAAIAGFAETIMHYEPAAATAWADAISDPNQRQQHLARSLSTWMAREPDQALEWLSSAELAPALRRQLADAIGGGFK
ncbi:MAG: hypothetical protein ACNA77_03085 [Opitutales bacterium]